MTRIRFSTLGVIGLVALAFGCLPGSAQAQVPGGPGCIIFGQSAGNGGNGNVGAGQPGFQISAQYFAFKRPNGSVTTINSFNVLDTTGKLTTLQLFGVKAALTRDTYVGVAPDGTRLVVKVAGVQGGSSQWSLTSPRGNASGTFIPQISSASIWGFPVLVQAPAPMKAMAAPLVKKK